MSAARIIETDKGEFFVYVEKVSFISVDNDYRVISLGTGNIVQCPDYLSAKRLVQNFEYGQAKSMRNLEIISLKIGNKVEYKEGDTVFSSQGKIKYVYIP